MNKDADMYFAMAAERFWKEEVDLSPCNGCKKRNDCFSQFNELTSEKMTNELFEAIKNCNIRNEMQEEWEQQIK